MDKDLALLIYSACDQSTRQLADIAPMVKQHAKPEDYEHLKLAIGSAIYGIMSEIMEYVENRCPGTEDGPRTATREVWPGVLSKVLSR